MMERKIKVVSNELNNKKLKLEDKLEKMINSNEDIGELQDMIIKTLGEIADIENTIQVWNNLLVEITERDNHIENGDI